MGDADTLVKDALSEAESEFSAAVKTINALEHPTEMKDALYHFVRGLDHYNQAVKFAEKYEVSAKELKHNPLKRDAVENFSKAMVDLLKSARVCFGNERRVLF